MAQSTHLGVMQYGSQECFDHIMSKTLPWFAYKNKFKVQAKVNSPVYHDDGIKTEKKAFSKIMYLDNPSSISIYPETKISIMGEINGDFIDKGINIDQGIVKVNIAANEFGNTFTKTTTVDAYNFVTSYVSEDSTTNYFYDTDGTTKIPNKRLFFVYQLTEKEHLYKTLFAITY